MKTKKELRKIARQVIKTNLVMLKAIHAVEEFSGDKIHLMDEEDIAELAKIIVTMKGGEEEMAKLKYYKLCFQQFEEFGSKLQKHLNMYDRCMICGCVVENYEPKYCCTGIECGCMGLPIEPCLCESCDF